MNIKLTKARMWDVRLIWILHFSLGLVVLFVGMRKNNGRYDAVWRQFFLNDIRLIFYSITFSSIINVYFPQNQENLFKLPPLNAVNCLSMSMNLHPLKNTKWFAVITLIILVCCMHFQVKAVNGFALWGYVLVYWDYCSFWSLNSHYLSVNRLILSLFLAQLSLRLFRGSCHWFLPFFVLWLRLWESWDLFQLLIVQILSKRLFKELFFTLECFFFDLSGCTYFWWVLITSWKLHDDYAPIVSMKINIEKHF